MKDMNSKEQLKLMAAAIYEIRILLSNYLGSQNDSDKSVRLAAHLSYALHNEAENILEGIENYDLEVAIDKIKAVEKILGVQYSDYFGALGIRDNS